MTGIMDHNLRRSIRSHIVAACDKRGIALANNVIENLINNRIKEVAEEIATGTRAPFVNWDDMVVRAYHLQEDGRQALIDRKVSVLPSHDG